MEIILYQPDIAQNLGAIMRSCACFDVPLSVIEPCGFPLTAKGLRRTAMDYGAPETLGRYKSWESFNNTPESGRQRGRKVLLTTKGATPLTDFAFQANDRLIFGRESAGVPDDVHAAMDERIIIPIAAGARSFNLSVSVAIALYEALRQTGELP